MTAAPAESLGTKGVRSLEVRWILPGQLTAAAADWFGRFPAETRVVDDAYLLDPHLPGLSVKVRGGRALEVKMYCGSPGLLELAGCAHGRLESWHKWSFPFGSLSRGSGDSADWRLIKKTRRISRFSLPSETIRACGHGPGGGERGCAVELTEVLIRGEAWWTLGFESVGRPGLLRSQLEATAALVFAETLPGAVEPCLDDSRSYAEWLLQWTDS